MITWPRTSWPTHTTLELVACVMVTVKYAMDIAGVLKYHDYSYPAAMALCILIDGAGLISMGLNGGTASMVVITLDRYWKIVHPIHHRKYYRRWMLYVGVFLPWLNGVAARLLPAIGTTRIVNGRCNPAVFWPTTAMEKVCPLRCELVRTLSNAAELK